MDSHVHCEFQSQRISYIIIDEIRRLWNSQSQYNTTLRDLPMTHLSCLRQDSKQGNLHVARWCTTHFNLHNEEGNV